MANRLNPTILAHLEKKLGKTAPQIRPRISEIRQENSGLTLNAAAQVYAQKHKTSVLPKLDAEDRQSLGVYQQARNITNNINYGGKRINQNVSVTAGHIFGNLIAGNNNSGNSQQATQLDSTLSELSDQINDSIELSDEEKNDLTAEVGTILSQSKKSSPDKDTIERSWSALSVLAKFTNIAGSVASVGQLLYQLGLIK